MIPHHRLTEEEKLQHGEYMESMSALIPNPFQKKKAKTAKGGKKKKKGFDLLSKRQAPQGPERITEKELETLKTIIQQVKESDLEESFERTYEYCPDTLLDILDSSTFPELRQV